jgi:hypothetical protein
MSQIIKLNPKVKPQRLPDGYTLDMEAIDGFSELEPEQKNFLIKYLDTYPAKNQAAIQAKVSIFRMKSWFEDPTFSSIAEIIRELYSESLARIHFDDAVKNSKIRGQVLKAVKAEGYDQPTKVGTQNNLVVDSGGGLASLLKLKQG